MARLRSAFSSLEAKLQGLDLKLMHQELTSAALGDELRKSLQLRLNQQSDKISACADTILNLDRDIVSLNTRFDLLTETKIIEMVK
jgi:uncharacterized coiled-coil protein SlyX